MKNIKIILAVIILLSLLSIQILANLNDYNFLIEKLEKQIGIALFLKKIDLSEDDAAYLFTISLNGLRKVEELRDEEIKILEKIKQAIYNDDYESIEKLSKELYGIEVRILEEQVKVFKEFENTFDRIKIEKLQNFLIEKGWNDYLKKIPFEGIVKGFDKLMEFVPGDIRVRAKEVLEKAKQLYNSLKAHTLFGIFTDEDFIEALRIVGKVNLENSSNNQ